MSVSCSLGKTSLGQITPRFLGSHFCCFCTQVHPSPWSSAECVWRTLRLPYPTLFLGRCTHYPHLSDSVPSLTPNSKIRPGLECEHTKNSFLRRWGLVTMSPCPSCPNGESGLWACFPGPLGLASWLLRPRRRSDWLRKYFIPGSGLCVIQAEIGCPWNLTKSQFGLLLVPGSPCPG